MNRYRKAALVFIILAVIAIEGFSRWRTASIEATYHRQSIESRLRQLQAQEKVLESQIDSEVTGNLPEDERQRTIEMLRAVRQEEVNLQRQAH